MPIWLAYLKRFMQRYGGKKVERTRDLFEQAVEKAPSVEGKKLYLLYAKFEEDFGLARRAMNIYERAAKAAEQKDKHEVNHFGLVLLLLSFTSNVYWYACL
jgi:pre-mRNA-splicing factor SYF1